MIRRAPLRALALCAFAPLACPQAAGAEALFILPLDCTPGRDCFIEDHVDLDPGPGVADYACGLRSRDGHKGTDFALAEGRAEATVRAAAAGQVTATRDGVADRPYTPDMAAALRGRECGNGVQIDHGDGLTTLYCHLRRGSVTVQPGDQVAQGAPLGRTGLSGLTNFPHLHFSVQRDGVVIDPFAPDQTRPPSADHCAQPFPGLWVDPIPYQPTGFLTAGFADHVPSLAAIADGRARRLALDPEQAMVLFARFHHAQNGDSLRLRITGPDEAEVIDHGQILRGTQLDMMRAAGRRAPQGGWPAGQYRGRATLMRGDRLIGQRRADVTVRP